MTERRHTARLVLATGLSLIVLGASAAVGAGLESLDSSFGEAGLAAVPADSPIAVSDLAPAGPNGG